MKTYLKITSFLFVSLSFFSCEKNITETTIKEKYTQYFNANIAGQSLNIKGSIDENRDIFSGSWTGVGNSDGTQKDMYRVKVTVPRTFLNTTLDAKLSFQVYDIKPGIYLLSDAKAYQKDFANHMYLATNVGLENSNFYTTNEQKNPFKIEITKYEKPKDSSVPIVGGKINGTLYNIKNLRDSIVIKDGVFEVRF
ncbi:DUF5025 domain-containing protein [Pedobacter petrophilus]|uniref:DUF5025 domain-containing protein n=1 Tax=Pedobacter petrophilus TaxID=1908241 RepID=A0A7K0G2L7_9SPHI|nr:DUF5025 domain-containing protein [Pedobacter petrophilus]MRX77216.1 DUF5025 domain-containing protein [Pedobacter petrophilus]